MFVQNRILLAQRLDLDRKALVGEILRIADDVDMTPPSSAFSAADEGGLVYWSGSRPIAELTWVDRQGRSAGGIGVRGALGNLGIAPDGRRLAVERTDTNPQSLFTIDLARGGAASRVTTDAVAIFPAWLADGTALFASVAKDGPPNIHRVTLGSRECTDRCDECRGGRLAHFMLSAPRARKS